MKFEKEPGFATIFFGVILIVGIAFLLLMGISIITLYAINTLYAVELIPITFGTVASLAWIKLVIGSLLTVKIRKTP
jgi:hypothetical protein